MACGLRNLHIYKLYIIPIDRVFISDLIDGERINAIAKRLISADTCSQFSIFNFYKNQIFTRDGNIYDLLLITLKSYRLGCCLADISVLDQTSRWIYNSCDLRLHVKHRANFYTIYLICFNI